MERFRDFATWSFLLRHCAGILDFRTIYWGQEPSSNRVVKLARLATKAGGIDSLESIPGLFKSFKIPSLGVPLYL